MSVVLVVEDDADLLAAISDGLVEEGWAVLAADSVGQALELARTRQVDVVLSDLRLADGDGPVTFRAGQGGAGGLPVVFMTGLPLRGRDLGATAVLTKPFEITQAAMVLRRALSQHRSANRKPARTAERSASAVEPAERAPRRA